MDSIQTIEDPSMMRRVLIAVYKNTVFNPPAKLIAPIIEHTLIEAIDCDDFDFLKYAIPEVKNILKLSLAVRVILKSIEKGNIESTQMIILNSSVNLKKRPVIHSAIRIQNTVKRDKMIEMLLSNGATLTYIDRMKHSSAHIAAQCGHAYIVSKAIQAGAGCLPDRNSRTPTHIAMENGYSAVLHALKDFDKLDLNHLAGDIHPLYAAAVHGHTCALRTAIQLGADVNAVSASDGRSALHGAAAFGSCETINVLIEAGISINTRTTEGETPLHFCVKSGKLQATNHLIELGADVTASDVEGETSLHMVLRSRIVRFRTCRAIVASLLNAGASVSACNSQGYMPLMLATWFCGDAQVVSKLLEFGANADEPCIDGYSRPMHNAAYVGGAAMVRALAKAGANVNCVDVYGNTPMSWAAFRLHPKVIRLLAQLGGSAKIADQNGKTPFDKVFIDSIQNYRAIIHELASAGCPKARAVQFERRWPYIRWRQLTEQNRATVKRFGPALEVANILADVNAFSSYVGQRNFRIIVSFL